MSYKNPFSPWCIIQHLPKMQRIVVGRFDRRNDAENHLRLIRQMCPHVCFSLIFDPAIELIEVAADTKQLTKLVAKIQTPLENE